MGGLPPLYPFLAFASDSRLTLSGAAGTHSCGMPTSPTLFIRFHVNVTDAADTADC